MEPWLINGSETMPRTDYPRPQWMRKEWICLNGQWSFAFDFGNSGRARDMITNGEYPQNIMVPFCPESRLSGIGYKDFIPAVWYRKTLLFDNLKEKLDGKRAILHFGAVDYFCEVWLNGRSCGTHKGGYTAFEFDVTDKLKEGENILVVNAQDDNRSDRQLTGKQCTEYNYCNCQYARTTGIWQTVWMEFVPQKYMAYAKMTPLAKDGRLFAEVQGIGTVSGDRVRLTAKYRGSGVGQTVASFSGGTARADLSVSEKHLWNPGEPELYDLTVELLEESDASGGYQVTDTVESYFALRDVSLTDKVLSVNGKPVFMRTILDQGFNPDGIYTAPDDEFLKRDIELSMNLGFNGARLHEKVFEDRTLYWADRLGYLVWSEFPMGIKLDSFDAFSIILPEWMEAVKQAYNHPSVIGWCPMNESYHQVVIDEQIPCLLYKMTKLYDSSRPVIDTSGGVHYDTDMFDVHDYEQDPEVFRQSFETMKDDPAAFYNPGPKYSVHAHIRNMKYKGQPYWVSEYGGIGWLSTEDGYAYGINPVTEEEFAERYEKLTDVLLSHPRIAGFCYTELYDVENEQNGLYYYDRSPKFSDWVYNRIQQANSKMAAVELGG